IRDRNVTGVQTCALPICEVRETFINKHPDSFISLYQMKRFVSLNSIDYASLKGMFDNLNASITDSKLGHAFSARLKSMEKISVRSEERRVGKECSYQLLW